MLFHLCQTALSCEIKKQRPSAAKGSLHSIFSFKMGDRRMRLIYSIKKRKPGVLIHFGSMK